MNIDLAILILVLIVNLIIPAISILLLKERQDKIFLVILNLTVYLYSGFGLCYVATTEAIVIFYLFFVLVLNFSLVFFLNREGKVEIIDYQKANFFFDSKWGKKFVNIAVILMFVLIIIQLFTLGVGVKDFLNFEIFDLTNIFIKEANVRENTLSYVLDLLQKLLTPFLFIKLYDLVQDRKRFVSILVFLLWIYLEALKTGYIGRYKIVIYSLFVCYLLLVKEGSMLMRKFIPIIVVFILAMPLLLAYEDYRLGRDISLDYNYVVNASKLIEKESDYPKYYTQIIDADIVSPIDYFTWLVTIVLPKKIFPLNAVSINDEFSMYISGLDRDDPYYSIILPSIFGEALLVYGLFFSWVHAIVLALILSVLIKFYRRFSKLSFLTIYLIVHVISIGRGGSQGIVAYFINISLLFVVMSFFVKYIKIEDKKEGAIE